MIKAIQVLYWLIACGVSFVIALTSRPTNQIELDFPLSFMAGAFIGALLIFVVLYVGFHFLVLRPLEKVLHKR